VQVREVEAVVQTATNGNNDEQIKTVQCSGSKQGRQTFTSAELSSVEV